MREVSDKQYVLSFKIFHGGTYIKIDYNHGTPECISSESNVVK